MWNLHFCMWMQIRSDTWNHMKSHEITWNLLPRMLFHIFTYFRMLKTLLFVFMIKILHIGIWHFHICLFVHMWLAFFTCRLEFLHVEAQMLNYYALVCNMPFSKLYAIKKQIKGSISGERKKTAVIVPVWGPRDSRVCQQTLSPWLSGNWSQPEPQTELE